MKRLMTAVSALALTVAGSAFAQEEAAEQPDNPVAISAWNYDQLYEMEGVRADTLMDTDVYDVEGENLGEVEEVYIQDDRIIAIVAEVGGFLDIGDTHVVVPWEQVEWGPDGFAIPVNEDNVEQYGMWADTSIVNATLSSIRVVDDGAVTAGEDAYRLTDLLSDYVTADGVGFGYVEDAIFSREGVLEAVVFMTRGGYYATPYYGPRFGYAPMGGTYDVGYDAEEVQGLEPFDYERVNDDWR